MKFGLIFVLLAATLPAPAQNQPSQKILSARQDVIQGILTDERREDVAKTRWSCMNGLEAGGVRDARAKGIDFIPDVSDECLAVLQRDAKDGQMIYIYQKLLKNLGGNTAIAYTLPKTIGNAVLSGDGKVSIGNNLAATVTPQIAFDAGFTVAFMENAAKKTMAPEKLKATTENCSAGKQDAGTCFSVGYVYGTMAVNAR